MPPISLLIKPASGSCNMRCRYCFYADEMNRRETGSYGVMTPQTLEAVLSKALTWADGQANIGFQGGEPTLAGLDFFRRVVALEARWKKTGMQVNNSIQTNGWLIDGDWADFLIENRFLIGLSMDGPKEIHDKHRLDASGKGTFRRVLGVAQLLAARKAEFNILTVVTPEIARRVGGVYGFYRKNKLLYQQYIPCLDPLEDPRGIGSCSLTPELYAKFLRELFQLWYLDRMADRFVYIRYFENLLMLLAGYPPESCGMSGRCVNQLVVEADGSVYPCDFYALDEWRLGNLNTDSLEEILQSPLARRFVKESVPLHPKCEACRWLPLCRGGCKRDRAPSPQGVPLHYYCEALEEFWPFAVPKLRELLQKIQMR